MVWERYHSIEEWDRIGETTPDQWIEFWRVCDEINIWSWPAFVGDRKVNDGLQYVLELRVGHRNAKSEGQCVGAPLGFQTKLMRLHDKLQTMVGWNSRQ